MARDLVIGEAPLFLPDHSAAASCRYRGLIELDQARRAALCTATHTAEPQRRNKTIKWGPIHRWLSDCSRMRGLRADEWTQHCAMSSV
jgi:hypothetical protein